MLRSRVRKRCKALCARLGESTLIFCMPCSTRSPGAPVDAGPGGRVLDNEVVAEEPGLLGAAVDDQGLVR